MDLKYIFPLMAGFMALFLAGCADLPSGTARTAAQSETNQVAEAALAVGDLDEAARLFELAAARNPDSVEAFLGLGRSYAALGQFSRAQSALLRARELRPRLATPHAELGKLSLLRGAGAPALVHFDAALALDNRNLAALTGKAVALDYLSSHAQAQEVYRQGLRLYPTNFALLSNHALSQVLSGNAASGISVMEELLGDATNGDTVSANLAIAYALEGREADARAMLQGVLSDAEINDTMALYAEARRSRAAGAPIGHLVFR